MASLLRGRARRLTDAGSLNLMLAATREIAGRLVNEVMEESRVSVRVPVLDRQSRSLPG